MFKLRVEKGADAGAVHDIPPEGLSVGRSSKNDLVFPDELLSRRHCRLWIEDGSLFIADLATVNGTQVNGSNITESAALAPGDVVTIGATRFSVSDADGAFPPSAAEPAPPPPQLAPVVFSAPPAEPAPASAAPQPEPAAPPPAPEPAAPPPEPAAPVDLGLRAAPAAAPSRGAAAPARTSRTIVNAVLLAVAVVLLAAAAKLLLSSRGPAPVSPVPERPPEPPLQFSYLKLRGTADNVFRYEMDLSADGFLTVSVDDLSQNRHLRKTAEEPLSEDARADLARAFEQNNFATLRNAYVGRPRRNEHAVTRVSALLSGRARTVAVENFPEPDDFRLLCERLETFGLTELGLWAAAYSREELVARAEQELERARRLHAERDIRRGHLFEAVRAFRAAAANLETLDPKPELYDEAVRLAADSARELQETVDRLNADADIAANTRDWNAAADALRELLETVPDRADDRYRAAFRKLREIEARMGGK